MEIRRSHDRLISTLGFPILVRRHLCIESGPRTFFTVVYIYRSAFEGQQLQNIRQDSSFFVNSWYHIRTDRCKIGKCSLRVGKITVTSPQCYNIGRYTITSPADARHSLCHSIMACGFHWKKKPYCSLRKNMCFIVSYNQVPILL